MASKVDKRRGEILSVLRRDGVVYVTELAKLFKVTSETIRNDFDVLAEEHGLRRIHGGLRLDEKRPGGRHYRYQERKSVHVEEKRRLCRGSAGLIQDGDHVYLDGGSTVSYLPSFLTQNNDLVLVTPSLPIAVSYVMEGFAEEFERRGNRLVMAGGTIDPNMLTTYGALFAESVHNLRFDKMIFSVDAVDLEAGPTNADELAFSIIRQVADRSRTRILLADSSKLGSVSSYRPLDWEQIDYFVTDEALAAEWVQVLNEHSVRYVQA